MAAVHACTLQRRKFDFECINSRALPRPPPMFLGMHNRACTKHAYRGRPSGRVLHAHKLWGHLQAQPRHSHDACCAQPQPLSFIPPTLKARTLGMTTHDMRRRIASDGCCGLGTLLMAKGSEIMSDMNVNLPKMHPQYACFRFCQYAPLQSLLVPPPIKPLARHGRAQHGTLSLPWLLFGH